MKNTTQILSSVTRCVESKGRNRPFHKEVYYPWLRPLFYRLRQSNSFQLSTSMDFPDFNLNIEPHLTIIDTTPANDEMSSSGDELLRSIEESEIVQIDQLRYKKTTEAERTDILENLDSLNTKRSTKYAVNLFKGKNN